MVSKNIEINENIFLIFAVLVIAEVLLKINNFQIFYIDQILINKYDLDQRTMVNDIYFRALGPSLNSSISSVILAIGIFKVHEIRRHYVYLIICLSAFLLCWSGSGFFILLMALVCKIRNNLFKLIIVISFALILMLDIPKINLNYIIYIYEHKITYLINGDIGDSIIEIIFGKNLKNELMENIGGDFIYINFIENYGLLLVVILTFLIIKNAQSPDRILIISGILASFHYGAIFNLMGQFIFGALIANKIQIYKNAIVKRLD
jgi:hypothetical protein